MRFIKAIPGISVLLLMALLLVCCGESKSDDNEKTAPLKQPGDNNKKETILEDKDNAAFYYNKAFDLMKFPPNPSAGTRVNHLVKMGWSRGGDQDFIDSFDANKESLAEFKKGLKKEKCDFFFNKLKIQLPSGESARNKAVWNMSCLNMVRFRYYESQGLFAEAFWDGLAVLTFLNHVAQGLPFMAKLTSTNCEQRCLSALMDILRKNKVDSSARGLLLDGLTKYEKNRYPAWKIMADEKKYYLFVVDWVSEQLTKKGEEKIHKEFGAALKKEAQILADEYYALAKAAYDDPKNEAKWKAVEDRGNALRAPTFQVRNSFIKVDDMMAHIRTLAEEKGKDGAGEVAQFLLGLYASSAKAMENTNTRSIEKLMALIMELSK